MTRTRGEERAARIPASLLTRATGAQSARVGVPKPRHGVHDAAHPSPAGGKRPIQDGLGRDVVHEVRAHVSAGFESTFQR